MAQKTEKDNNIIIMITIIIPAAKNQQRSPCNNSNKLTCEHERKKVPCEHSIYRHHTCLQLVLFDKKGSFDILSKKYVLFLHNLANNERIDL